MWQMWEIRMPVTGTQRYPLYVFEQEAMGHHEFCPSCALPGSLWDTISVPFRDHLRILSGCTNITCVILLSASQTSFMDLYVIYPITHPHSYL